MKNRSRTAKGAARSTTTRRLAKTNKTFPRKQFGQHFLRDRNIIDKVVKAAEIAAGDIVLEIGPGLGHLTRALAESSAQVVAVEIDEKLASQLAVEMAGTSSVKILQGDFLSAPASYWLKKAGYGSDRYKVVANLPYYITSGILRQLLEAVKKPSKIVVMVQREVALQITARPGKMSMLALSVQFYGQPVILETVRAGAFYPMPKVDSAILVIDVNRRTAWPEVEAERFFRLARAGFAGRRKQMRNSLAGGLAIGSEQSSRLLAKAGIDPTRRAESLSLEEWKRIYEAFQAQG